MHVFQFLSIIKRFLLNERKEEKKARVRRRMKNMYVKAKKIFEPLAAAVMNEDK